jgi:hypothetical protein|nr:MAG TPA: Trimeric autotransporter adhesin, trimeric autotransporter adhesin, TAA.97A [Caudoviricetes sp.]
MNQEELAKYRVLAEQNRRLRREVDRLRGMLGRETEESRAFDEENRGMFAIISRNHADKATQTETFYFGN